MREVNTTITQSETPTGNKLGATFNLRTPQNPAGTLQKFGTKNDVGELLGICNRSVDNLLAKGCPHLKLGKRRVRFDLDEVREWAKREFGTRRNGPANGKENAS